MTFNADPAEAQHIGTAAESLRAAAAAAWRTGVARGGSPHLREQQSIDSKQTSALHALF